MFKSRAISSIEEILKTKKNMKARFGLEITYLKYRYMHLMLKWNGKLKQVMYVIRNVFVVAKSNDKAVLEKQLNELATMMDTLYLND